MKSPVHLSLNPSSILLILSPKTRCSLCQSEWPHNTQKAQYISPFALLLTCEVDPTCTYFLLYKSKLNQDDQNPVAAQAENKGGGHPPALSQ